MKLSHNAKFRISIVLNVILIFGFFLTIIFWGNGKDKVLGLAPRDYSSEYVFTNPILDYEEIKMGGDAISYKDLSDMVDKLKDQHGLSSASLYYRDLNNGQWIGVNEKEPFVLASLAKLPVFIAFLKQAEMHNGLLEKKVTINKQDVQSALGQNIPPENSLIPGAVYTIEQIANKMIKDSDNPSLVFLLKMLDQKFIEGVFKSVGVPFVKDNQEVMIRVKDYAAFFRVLFNASYLNRESSEKALSILSEVKFDGGITAGVPAGIVVAHKFGERLYVNKNGPTENQFHDCGIVYAKERPYILCVMTRGKDFNEQSLFIRDVSKFIYSKVVRE